MSRHADRPIRDFDEDQLGYGPFARALAKTLTMLNPENGFVIGLHAPWGMGKTSALNLAVKALTKEDPEKQKRIIVPFNPWNLGGRDDLYRAFFAKLGDEFEQGGLAKAAELARDYGQRLITAAPELAAAWGHFTAGNLWSGAKSGLASLRAVRTKSAKPTKSLETLREELSRQLRKEKPRVIVVMDDLDRLLPDEMRDMFTLVKSLGDLPYVIYLLAFDRRVVTQGLEAAGIRRPEDGPDFLEKLVQTYLDLPTPSREGLDRMFFTSLDEVFGENIVFDKERWSSLYSQGLQGVLTSPRTVARVINGIAVSWPPIAGQVDMPDFVGLETIRILEPDLYSSIRRHLGWLVGFQIFSDDKAGEKVADDLQRSLRNDDKSRFTFVVSSLFPRLEKIEKWPKSFIIRPNYLSLRAERRLATEEFYSHYFTFTARDDYPTAEFVADVATHLDDAARCHRAFDEVSKRATPAGTTLTGRLLNELADRIEAKALPTGELLNVLLERGDDLAKLDDEEQAAFFSVTNDTRIRRLLPLCVRAIPQHERGDVLISHIGAARAPWTVTSLWWKLAEEHGKVGERRVEPEQYRLVDTQTLDRIGAALVGKLRALASTEAFLDAPHLSWILHSWLTAGANAMEGDSHLPHWIGENLQEPRLVASLADGMMNKSRPVGEKRWRHALRRDTRQDLVTIERLSEAVRNVLAAGKETTPDQRETLRAFENLSRKVMGGADAAAEQDADELE